jgi:hypothetical protein
MLKNKKSDQNVYASPLSSTESQAHRFCSAKIPLTNSNRDAHKQQQERSQTRKVTRTSTPPPSPPRNLRLTGFVLQKYRSQTAKIPLTNSNKNAHKLQQERSQTRKVTRTSTPPPSPPRNLRLTGFVLQQYRSQTATGTLRNCNENAHKQEK